MQAQRVIISTMNVNPYTVKVLFEIVICHKHTPSLEHKSVIDTAILLEKSANNPFRTPNLSQQSSICGEPPPPTPDTEDTPGSVSMDLNDMYASRNCYGCVQHLRV
ncbi:hypothetical protein NPIL_344261 [Nephila pilipes]|uniref:Uncharacterized protein n=1 Tax=Nephila pilipes TaxID=299642 RepID=A0A8X6P4J1_NEPPI|nr:hypothetical protein NPIL_344261 [Nephila pilipes]